MKVLKGKDKFTTNEIKKLEELINFRIKTPPSGQRAIRQKMRNLGFYGQDDWGITDLQIADLHLLIESGRIKVLEDNSSLSASIIVSPVPSNLSDFKSPKANNKDPFDIEKTLDLFKSNYFDPKLNIENDISDSYGNYIICLRKGSRLPPVSITPVLTKYEGLEVVYTGISSASLKTRDYSQHFKGNNSGRSTLRKSLGVLFGYKLIPRDPDPNNGKTKFKLDDELELSKWMLSNLIMFFLPHDDFNRLEVELINKFNPPLNIKHNHNSVNAQFRRLLSKLRTKRA